MTRSPWAPGPLDPEGRPQATAAKRLGHGSGTTEAHSTTPRVPLLGPTMTNLGRGHIRGLGRRGSL
eukprot:7795065-Pyramimonas_sp.AAC.1